MEDKLDSAFVIGNAGLGDIITYIGMVNYLSCQYRRVFVACMAPTYNQVKLFFHKKNIIVYPINRHTRTNMYAFHDMMVSSGLYDIYAFGHYGALSVDVTTYTKVMKNGKRRIILYDYPQSYYDDAKIDIKVMREYFSVKYPENIEKMYNDFFALNIPYTVVHQTGSTVTQNLVEYYNLDIDKRLIIDVEKNLYPNEHKFHDIAQQFVRLPSVIYYTKLIENANELYLIDSCIHAIALVVDLKAKVKICHKRAPRIKYAFNKFKYVEIELECARETI
jgi:hypothetical protein